MPQPDLMRMLGQGQVDVTDLAYQFGLFAQNNKWGPIIANGDQIAPNAAIATFAVRKDYLAKNRDAVIRWSMAYLQGVKEFNAAAKDPAKHPEIIEILAKNTALNKPELVRAIAPNWCYINEDGVPAVELDHGHAGLLEREVFQLRREEGHRRSSSSISASPRRPRLASIGKSRSVRERAGSSHASDRLVGPVPPCRRAGPGEFMTNEFWRWQACDLAQAIRTRRISSREAVTSCLARLAAVNPRINAVVDCLPDEALAAADAPIARSRRVSRWDRCTACR